MSENIPTSAPKKPKRKHERIKLPTPPPDPHENAAEKENDFFEYLDSLQKSMHPPYSRSTSTFTPAVVTEEAFDHLEKLYKLMEQMLELREQNAKLHRRVRDLEHLNNLEKMHKQLEISGVQRDCPELDKDTAFAETILESILSETRKDPKKIVPPMRLRPSILRRQRNRSGSATEKTVTLEADTSPQRRAATSLDNRSDKPAKVSKWTKVKAAFKWEKASTSVGDSKSQDSGICGMAPMNLEIARYLRVPSTSDDYGHSPADSGAAEISTPGSLSTASSNEDFHRNDLRVPTEDFRSSEDEHSHNYIPHHKEDQSSSKSCQKCPRTPWAKMKDIIQTRNSFKKKHRLSAQSDDVQIDIELCSDNEDVFEDDTKNKSAYHAVPSPTPACSNIYMRVNSNEIPLEIIARYQKVLAEDDKTNTDSNKISKWIRVKKAFITSADDPKTPLSKKSSRNEDQDVQDEIQKNYRQLQKKLSLEFREKLSEWERMKQSSPGTSNPSSSCGYVDDAKDQIFLRKMEEWQKLKSQPLCKNRSAIQMTREDELPPEFKKKLQEWEKIKKTSAKENSPSKKKLGDVPRWKSLSGHRSETNPSSEYPTLSEDFRKKLEEWKQIKASGGVNFDQKKFKEKTPSPKLSRKNSSPKHSKKQKDHDKELHWFEKELSKIEKEKLRLERERQKFLEREERLSKIRRSVIGGNKKEVLIHTPSGFYRFEGISRKFTQKLYEWEKAQGIGPEASTFALLSSSYTADTRPMKGDNSAANTPPLTRSKSADSIAISALNLTCPLMSHQPPSSLSLNDVDELEKECLVDSKSSSMQYLLQSRDYLNMLDEPEALIIEVEDYEEETAAPLEYHTERQQLPVYQRQEGKILCEGETVAAPKIRRSESTRAQTNYNLIEEIFCILKLFAENELELRHIYHEFGRNQKWNEDKIKAFNETQKRQSTKMVEKLGRLQEANTTVVSSISKEEKPYTLSHLVDILDAVQDLSNEVFQMAEKLDQEIENRRKQQTIVQNKFTYSSTAIEIVQGIRSKMLDLRRNLSYVCAASDMTAPGRKRSSGKKTLVHKTMSSESKESRCDTSDTSRRSSDKNSKDNKRYVKAESSNTQSQGAIKKRIKYRQKSLQNRSLPDTDDEEDVLMEQRKNKHKKLTRTRSTSENTIEKFDIFKDDSPKEPIPVDEKLIERIIVPTETNFVNADLVDEVTTSVNDSPVTLFVKTTRKLFTPIVESNLKNSPPKTLNLANQAVSPEIHVQTNQNEETPEKENTEPINPPITHLPPLPASPVPQRRVLKDVSPSIRLMLAKYNQKLTEHESPSKSGGSSGSASPIWRSPISERRVKAQTERYQEEHKLSPLLGGRREVQKSASVGFLHSSNKQVTVPSRSDSLQNASTSSNKHILKSSSTSYIPCNSTSTVKEIEQQKNREDIPQAKKNYLSLKLVVDEDAVSNSRCHSPEVRMLKLQKAKEEFLNSPPVSAPPKTEALNFPSRNRLSQISVDSESSYDSSFAGALVKSASAGMINIDPDTYRQFDPEMHGGGYVSLPRCTKQPKDGMLSGKFAFSNIASKFRKVKMRRGKEKNQSRMNTVSTLCRQSLVVDINVSEEGQNQNEETANLPQPISRSTSWIKKPKIFKK